MPILYPEHLVMKKHIILFRNLFM